MKRFQSAAARRHRAPKYPLVTSRLHRRIVKRLEIILVILALLFASADAQAQRRKKKPAGKSQAALDNPVAKAKQEVIRAAEQYKTSLEQVLALQQDEVKQKAERVEKLKSLSPDIISKKEVQENENALAVAEAKVAETRKKMGEADNLMAEAAAEEKLARMPPVRLGAYQATAALIRYNGPSRWVLTDATKVESFFLAQFHHSIPISAFGQTPVHTQLGFDHSNSMDVAVHPDSAEGQGLMAYLRSMGIPFIAFRQAVAGSATGAHIHIGYPSHRIR